MKHNAKKSQFFFKSKVVLIATLLTFIFISFTTAVSIGETNIPNGVSIISSTVSASSGSGGNITSVSSGNGCIFVSPTTGDVIITFNTSCGGTSSGTYNATYDRWAYNMTTPFTNWLSTFLYNYNQTTPAINDINNRFWNKTQTYNKTEINSFNASWITTYNATYNKWAYNMTAPVFTQTLLNNTIANYGVRVGFNSTYNSTYATWAYNQTIMRNIFNQDLNTTNDVTFNKVTTTNITSSTGYNSFDGLGDYYKVYYGSYLGFPVVYTKQAGLLGTIEAGFMEGGLFLYSPTNNIALLYFADDTASNNMAIWRDKTETIPTLHVQNLGSAFSRFSIDNMFALLNRSANVTGTLEVTNNIIVNRSSSINKEINQTGYYGLNFTGKDVTSSRTLDTTYTNNNSYPLEIHVTGQLDYLTDGEQIYFDCETSFVRAIEGFARTSVFDAADKTTDYRELVCIIPPNQNYTIVTHVTGSNSITLMAWVEHPVK